MTKETRKHYIYDEALKVEREYAEVDGEASVGDYVVMHDYYHGNTGDILKVRKVDIYRVYYFEGKADGEGSPAYLKNRGNNGKIFSKLAPTGNVRLSDGQCYRLAERKAAVGDRVIVTNPFLDYYGKVIDVSEVDGEGDVVIERHSHGGYGYATPSDFRVLDPVESAEPTPQAPEINVGDTVTIIDNFAGIRAEAVVKSASDSEITLEDIELPEDGTEAPPKDTADLLANLVRRVAELESQNHANSKEIHNLARENESILEKYEALTKEMASIRRDLQTFAEVAETAKHTAEQNRSKPKEVARKVIDDINEYYRKGGCV